MNGRTTPLPQHQCIFPLNPLNLLILTTREHAYPLDLIVPWAYPGGSVVVLVLLTAGFEPGAHVRPPYVTRDPPDPPGH